MPLGVAVVMGATRLLGAVRRQVALQKMVQECNVRGRQFGAQVTGRVGVGLSVVVKDYFCGCHRYC